MNVTVERAKTISGQVAVPGDKSIAHRALILGAMAGGVQVIRGLPRCDDVSRTLVCLDDLGCTTRRIGDTVELSCAGLVRRAELFAGNSGTTARLICGLAAGAAVQCTLDGDASLRRRPMERVAVPLRAMGAHISTAPGGRLPLTVRGGSLQSIHYALPVASAQVKSAVLLAGVKAEGVTTVEEPAPTRDHTERMLAAMGAPVAVENGRVSVRGPARLDGIELCVPGDISSAAFLIAAAVLLHGSEVVLPGVGINPTRAGFLETLRRMGADVRLEGLRSVSGEPVGDVVARSSELRGAVVEPETVPSLIDELPILAVLATQAHGTTLIRGAGELRHKESDRIEAIVSNLCRLGARVEGFGDGFLVRGPSKLVGARVRSFGDHRIAMAMAVAALVAEGTTTIEGAHVASVSYPGFFDQLRELVS